MIIAPKKYNLIILDRDGVINVDCINFIRSPAEWQAIPGSIEAIAKLTKAGYLIAIATNQSGVARGYFSYADLEAIHQKMLGEITKVGGKIEGIFICPHGPEDNCECRKPKPGLLKQVSNELAIPKDKIIAVGDSIRDIEAAKAFGCDYALVLTGNGKYTLNINPSIPDNIVFSDLAEFADHMLDA